VGINGCASVIGGSWQDDRMSIGLRMTMVVAALSMCQRPRFRFTVRERGKAGKRSGRVKIYGIPRTICVISTGSGRNGGTKYSHWFLIVVAVLSPADRSNIIAVKLLTSSAYLRLRFHFPLSYITGMAHRGLRLSQARKVICWVFFAT